MNKSIFDDYLIRPMKNNVIRVYYLRIFPNGKKGYMPIGDFELERIQYKTLKSIDREIKSKCETIIEKHLAGLN